MTGKPDAQRPDATAVLPIEGKSGWNERFGRWVNRGATGIAVFDGESAGRTRLKYYFDISDTHGSRTSRPVPVWEMREGDQADMVEALSNSFGELEDSGDFASALLSAAKNAVEDHMSDYLDELYGYTQDSFLEDLDSFTMRRQSALPSPQKADTRRARRRFPPCWQIRKCCKKSQRNGRHLPPPMSRIRA